MSKHVDLRVHRRSNYTEYSDLTGWIAPHVPNASPCIPASLCAMCQRVCVCVCGSSCSSSSDVVHCPWFLWVSLGAWLLGGFGQGQQTRNGHESNRHNDHPSLRFLKGPQSEATVVYKVAAELWLWLCEIVRYPFETWPSAPKLSRLRTACDHIWCCLIAYDPTIL